MQRGLGLIIILMGHCDYNYALYVEKSIADDSTQDVARYNQPIEEMANNGRIGSWTYDVKTRYLASATSVCVNQKESGILYSLSERGELVSREALLLEVWEG